MIANFDLVSILVNIAGDDLVISLFSLGDDVERVADFHAHIFILRRVIDVIFADKLLIAFIVFLVKPNRTGRQWHTELILLRVAKLNVNADFLFNRLARIVVAGEVVTLPVHHEFLLHIKTRRLQQRHLLCLVIADSCRAL